MPVMLTENRLYSMIYAILKMRMIFCSSYRQEVNKIEKRPVKALMEVDMKRFIAVMMAVIMLCSITACGRKGSGKVDEETKEITLDSWSPIVRNGINDMMKKYGKSSKSYDDTTYAVFDFDNTCSIFDVEEQLAVYQLQHMAFAEDMDKEKLGEVLATGLGDISKRRGVDYSSKDATYQDWIDDITKAYGKLLAAYGPFTPAGFDDEKSQQIQKSKYWKEFATKMRAMYDLVYDSESAKVAYPWVLYWFTGFTEEQVYTLAKASHEYYKEQESEYVTWTSPKMKSKAGICEYEWTSGVQVPDNIKELMSVLKNNGIKVYICSASSTDVVRAAIDVWDLHDSVDGLLAMTNKMENGVYINEYDYDSGYGWIAAEGDKWERGKKATKAQTQGKGKVTAINNVLVKEYGHGPIAGFMDSTGDFNFCTEYKTLKLVCCFNRASRKVTDGGGLIAELAVYQNMDLEYDFEKADAAGDIYYVLQGRDENGFRTLRDSDATVRLDESEEDAHVFRTYDEDEDNLNELELEYFRENNMTTEEIINTLSIHTKEKDPENKLGFEYGFLSKDEFSGYKSID